MGKNEELKDSSKVNMFEYSEVANQLVEQKKRELADLQHNLLLANSALTATQQQISKDKVAFEQWKKSLETEREKNFQKKQQDFDAKIHALDINVANFEKRSSELKQREIAVSNLFEDRQRLNLDRIEVERLRTKAEELMSQAVKKSAEATSLFNMARQKEEDAKRSEEKAVALNQDISRREVENQKKAEDAIIRLRNLNEVQRDIEPRIKELELISEANKEKEKELSIKEKDITRKIEEYRSIVNAFSDREKKLKLREDEFSTKEREVAKKI